MNMYTMARKLSQLLNKAKKLKIPLWVYFVVLLFLSSLNLLFALRTNTYFSVDDFAVLYAIKNSSFLGMVSDFVLKGDPFGFRKVMGYVVFRGVFEVFGTNPWVFIFTNFLFHIANVFLVFFLVKLLTKKNISALLSAILFNKIYLFYFSNIHEYLVTLFSLASIYVFLKFPKKRMISLFFFLLALLTKEVAFSVPFFLVALSFVTKADWKKVKPFFWVLAAYAFYQLYFLVSSQLLPTNTSYQVSVSLEGFVGGVSYYLGLPLLFFLLLLPFVSKKYKTYGIFFIGLLALLPALFLVNRRELYYLYFPTFYFVTFLALNIPEKIGRAFIVVLVALYVFGGLQVLPSFARQEFPNWQKESIDEVVERVESGLQEEPEEAQISLGDINLERDARLMLESRVVDLFVKKDISTNYNFVYDQQSAIIIATRKEI